MFKKQTASPGDFVRFIPVMYEPSFVGRSPLQRLQFHFMLDVVTYGVTRPGESATSKGYEPDNEGVVYGVSAACIHDGQLSLTLS